VRAAVGLGSNLGDRRAHLSFALHRLAETEQLTAVSSLYETAPIGGPEQDAFYNAVAVLETSAGARRLLARCLAIERERGRTRRVRWGPRTLDLDVLLHEGGPVDEKGLTVPHPRLVDRRFALEPLVEAWPEATLPGGAPLSDYLAGIADQEVTVIAGGEWWISRARGRPA
jgi:2-amino-4-hydroxy-6-hydroxymethyldihydropteridine diphosphokinase